MSKLRNLPQITSLDDADLLYAVDVSAGPNGGRKITKLDLKTSVALTPAEVKSEYESNPDTNAFTDAEKTKLAGIEAGATADQNASEVPYDNSGSGLTATDVNAAIDEVNVHAQADFRPSIVSGRILHYSGGSARFDGVFYQLTAGDILLNPSITNGEVYVDLDGIVKQTASNTLAPPYTVVFAKFSTDLNDITGLVDERVKNAQNIVRGILSDVRDVRAGASASEGNSGRVSDAMHKHNVLTGAPSAQSPDQANAEGTSANLARADHIHNIPADAPTTNLSPATSNAEGSGTSFARNDHTHALAMAQAGDFSTVNAGDAEALGTADRLARADHQHPVATATAVGLDANSSSAEGASTSLARANHTHAIATGAPSTQAPDQANAAGSSANLARADHIHNIPADAPTTTLSPATSNAEGVGSSFARNDHTHAVATALVGDITTIQPDAAANAGVANTFARGDHRHAIDAAAPSTLTPDQANTEGASTSFARADHIHNVPAGTPGTTLSPATVNAKGAAASVALSDHTHAVATGLVGEITTIQPDDAAAAGTVDKFARADHRHAIVAAAPAAQAPDQANAEGVSTSFARADHIHNIPADAPTTTLSPATTNAEGVGTSFARNDHTHAVATGLVGEITTIQPDDAAAAGTVDKFARADHKHAIVAAAASSISTSTTNTEGSSTSFARADHTHAVSITNSEATATADDTTTSATDVLMVSMTLTPAAGTYLVMWSGSIVNSANGAERTWVSLYSGGSQVSATERSIGTGGGAYSPAMTHAVVTVTGSQAIELRWRVAGGTSTVHSRRLSIARVG